MTRDEYRASGAKLTAKRGNDLPHAKLNPETVRAIRANVAKMTAKEWADSLGLHQRTIDKVRTFGSWRHVL